MTGPARSLCGLAVACSAVAIACRSAAPPPPPAVPDVTARRALEAAERRRSGVALLLHKVSLTSRLGEMVLTGQLAVDPNRGLRAVAVDEVGGVVFDVSVCRQGATIHRAPPRLPRRLLLQGPVEDLRLLFLAPPQRPDVLPAGHEGARLSWSSGGRREEWLVDAGSGRVVGLRQSRGRHLIREARLEYTGQGSAPWPDVIEMVNAGLDYRIDVRLLRHVAPPPPDVALGEMVQCPSPG